MNLNTSLLKAVSQFPDRVAVSDGMKRLTYEELGKRVGALVEVFDSLGLEAGDVVACLAPNCHEYLELYYGCAFARTVQNPLNFRLGPLEISSILKDSSARVLVAHSDFKEL
ncbi:MAG TPA: AMP-binding protein, partial [Candidatus Melainabacteria bacterium]|nr:AMP-binding protein [Candidatus Melainabacteria bacterium]